MTRPLKRDIDALASTPFDLCVIGGDITSRFGRQYEALGLGEHLGERGLPRLTARSRSRSAPSMAKAGGPSRSQRVATAMSRRRLYR